jgi:hypothetical protein
LTFGLFKWVMIGLKVYFFTPGPIGFNVSKPSKRA